MMQDYKNIMVWQKAHELVKDIYSFTADFPNHELFRITSQIRRAAVSIPTNIVEDSGKRTQADFARFCGIAFGSAAELECLIFLSYELKYQSENDYFNLSKQTEEIKKMLSGLIKKLKTVN